MPPFSAVPLVGRMNYESEEINLQKQNTITLIVKRKEVIVSISTILYVLMTGNSAKIHVRGGKVYEARIPLVNLMEVLEEDFILIRRGCMVSVMAIHEIGDKVILSSGEQLKYTVRKKKEIIAAFREKQQRMIRNFSMKGLPATPEEYRAHYAGFESMPFAFTDIEMVFDDQSRAVDWVFRYGNSALAKLEKIPLDRLIGSSFGTLFPNMDSKWLRSYERAALYGETLEIMDYSPEIDTNLKVICFPTYPGHCGCILFDISQIQFTRSSSDAEKTLMLYLGRQLGEQD